MSESIRIRLTAYLEALSRNPDWESPAKYTAAGAAATLGISRTLASQYFNREAAAGTLIKVNTRPVYFFHRQALSGESGAALEDVYDSLEDLKSVIRANARKASAFDRLIGAEGTLLYQVEQCKAAVSYPGAGLPILLWGPTGTGKSFLAQLTYDYAVEKGILSDSSRFVAVNCSEYANNPEFFLTHLFGYTKGAYTGADRERKGLISSADGGVLFLDEVHCLSGECQEKLFHFMDKGTYRMVGDNERWYRANVHIILATTEDPSRALLKTLVRRIPLITVLPSLATRSLREKKELLYHQIEAESRRVGREIVIRRAAYRMMIGYPFPENVGQLVNCVKICAANAILTTEPEKPLEIQIHHLPAYLLENHFRDAQALRQEAENDVIDLENLREEWQRGRRLLTLNRDILHRFETAEKNKEPEDCFSFCRLRLEQYFDELIPESKNDVQNPRTAFRHSTIQNICVNLARDSGAVLQDQDVEKLCLMADDFTANFSICAPLEKKHEAMIRRVLERFRESSESTFTVAQSLADQLSTWLSCTVSRIYLLDLNVCMHSFTPFTNWNHTAGILVAHGYSTASSIAAAANHTLGRHVFDAVDMPMEAPPTAVAAKLAEIFHGLRGAKDALILADTGPLEQICDRVSCAENINIGLMDNLTIQLAISAGGMILKDVPVASIIEACCAEPVRYESVLRENRKRPNAILSVCATGIGTAEKVSQLFMKSFPRPADISVISYSYGSLVSSGKETSVFEKYNVLFIVGTQDPCIPGYPFLALEDLLEQRGTDSIDEKLSKLLTREELQAFNRNLLKYFSLNNLISQLTILNPEKIVSHVEKIIQGLQKGTGIKFSNRKILGLYLHISCLIERLITEKYAVNYQDLKGFEEWHPDFINMTDLCFLEIEKSYGVSIPASEIAYLYDYIYKS